MFQPGDRVLVAVSGGPDSVALLRVLQRLSEKWRLRICGAYFNHRLRGPESRAEETFVESLFQYLSLPLEKGRMDARVKHTKTRGNLEEICREARYRFLESVRRKLGFDKVALGHHRGDQVETVLMHLLRGSGLEGMKGMLPVRDAIYIRPLLEATREEILLFLQKEGLRYVLDRTNESEAFHRNRVRHHLLRQVLNSYNPRVEENISHLAGIVREENDYINTVVDEIVAGWDVGMAGGVLRVGIEDLKSLHPALQKRLILRLLQRVAKRGKGIGYTHVQAVVSLLEEGRTGGSLDLPGGIRVHRGYGKLVMTSRGEREGVRGQPRKGMRGPRAAKEFSYAVRVPGTVRIPGLGLSLRFDLVEKGDVGFGSGKKRAYMDYERVARPIRVRNVRPGDRIQPLGMKGRKKVTDLFIDEKIARDERSRLPIVVDRDSVLWVPGVRLSDKVKIRDGTKSVLKVEIN
ncbi:MAG TPA: tRNA lysidine(34) synthetase TilS [Syntrophales bacterium]|nr:tRNA lysidine(34) synthetase TilS [Syntrophales bacterium]HOX95455.1 tRNA lysidine(34) synthetase TilS [Syntrophales bacterium]HPI56963.1 tRNA lysidine(34) synthetase TilS [Syntrophales bacterium]HPN23549.1 tRNA lysidine(34) synthetase TilS [Syntrophales bacterium]HQM27926.1 tRNA lysidine(34) synthetase TilS [Syntrophales bacterium]